MAKVTERFAAIVTKIDDPTKRGRIKVKSSEMTGEKDTELPEWIDPCFDWGWFFVPDIGEEVEIEAITHDDYEEDTVAQAFIDEPRMRWRGKRFVSEEGEQPRPPAAFFGKNYGKRRGFATPNGHVLFFDDTSGGEQITLSWSKKLPTGEVKHSFLSLDKDGSLLAATHTGSMLYLNAKDAQVLLADENGNSFSGSEDGVSLIDKFGGFVQMKENHVQVVCPGDVTVKAAGNVNLDAGTVNVGAGADSPFVRYVEWLAYNDAHQHPTGTGPSGPPLVPAATMPTIASTVGKVK